MIPGTQFTPIDWALAVWRGKWIVFVSLSLATTAAVVVAGRLPDRFRASALIVTVPQGVSQEFVRATVTSKPQLADRLPTIREQILSRARLEPIIQELDLYADMRRAKTMEAVIDRMRTEIQIDIASGSEALRVSYETATPLAAFRGAEQLAKVAIEESVRDRTSLARDTRSFLEGQLEAAGARLEEKEQLLEAYRLKHGAELPSQMQSNMQAIEATQMQIQALNDSIDRNRDRRMFVERQLADLQSEQFHEPPAGAKTAAPVAARTGTAADLEAALAALRDLEATLTAEHPDRVRAERRVSDLRSQLQREAAAPAPPAAAPLPPTANEMARRTRTKELQAEVESLDRQLANREVEAGKLRKTLEMYRARVEALPMRESELASLNRDYDTLQGLYKAQLAKKEDAKVAEALESLQLGQLFKIADPPRKPERPTSPNRRLIDLAGAIAGLALGIGLVLFRQFRDDSLRTESDVRALGLPLLSVIPLMQTERERRRARLFRAAASAGVATVFVLCVATVWLNFRM